ncbi:NANOG neighbor homeobox [Plecturocebus cupreus]
MLPGPHFVNAGIIQAFSVLWTGPGSLLSNPEAEAEASPETTSWAAYLDLWLESRIGQVWWLTPVIPVLWEAEAGRSQGQAFETSLANMVTHLPRPSLHSFPDWSKGQFELQELGRFYDSMG